MQGNDSAVQPNSNTILVPGKVSRQRQEGRGVVKPDIAKDDDNRRDHQRQQGDEFNHRAQARQLEAHPIGRGHHDQCADEDGEDRHHD